MPTVTKKTRNALEAIAEASPAKPGGPLSGAKGAAAGLALAALPVAVEQVVKRAGPKVSEKASDVGGRAGGKLKQATTAKAKEVAGEAAEKAKPRMPQGIPGVSKLFGGGSDGSDGSDGSEGRAAPGYGSGRRMPIQQSVDVAVPLEVAYNAWTQFENWPKFMHRVESADQEDDTTVTLGTKVWGVNRRAKAKIRDQHPDQRIEWSVEEGLAHTGVVTFHPLGERLTRIEVTFDVEPHGMLEKAGRGMRYMKRAARGDLHRFKAFVELEEDEIEGGWRGTIEDGKVKRSASRRPSGGRKRSQSGGGTARAKSRTGSRKRAPARGGSKA